MKLRRFGYEHFETEMGLTKKEHFLHSGSKPTQGKGVFLKVISSQCCYFT